MIVLIDTNILLDHLQQRPPHKDAATRVWKLVEEGKLGGLVSAISFNNVFYIARKHIGADKALAAVKLLRRVFRLVPLDDVILDLAMAMSMSDLEDAIQAATAKQSGAEYIVTRDAGGFRRTNVTCITAEELLALI